MRKKSAFTLMEIMVVAIISIIILVPSYRVFMSSSRSSIKGLKHIDLVMEGRRLIKQIKYDLKSACTVLPLSSVQYSFFDLIAVSGGSGSSLAGTSFTFLSFPLHGDLNQAVSAGSTSGFSIKCANEVTYKLESGAPGSSLLVLKREEKVHPKLGGGTLSRVLSKRVNFFSIRPVEIQTTNGRNQWFCNITLQLADAQNLDDLNNLPPNTLIQSRQKGIMIVDFFDVVCPLFFAEIWNQCLSNRNWQTLIQAP
ncbi:MAG: prepilin-type N-terminal cleavage/methylation domain-containing protein [Candidatus Riflebacteria bacterium]|nr:prepilin-type N-terminal cleavage/methylation domain-containing protein [Candidatus Riflebacteria bacterium]